MDDQVSLDACADQIRELVRNDRNDEAIAICKHILHYYPKHIETYRQMAEAYLKKGELEEAKDLFRRVLGADPENVVAYVSLASIFEKHHLNSEAAWHMERAYELAPTNPEIGRELLRLYGEAHGRAPARLKLTPTILGRLYIQEGLYAQAVQELRAVVTEDPARLDAYVALAETLWRTGRMREAAGVAQKVLDSLQFCLKANLILGTAWKESGLPEGEVYLQRAQALDPMNQAAQRLPGIRPPLPLTQVFVPRYVEGTPPPPLTRDQPEAAGKPTPASSISSGQILASKTAEETLTAPDLAESLAFKPDLPTSNLPSWLRTPFPETTETHEEASEPGPMPTTPTRERPAETPSWLEHLQETVSEQAPTTQSEEVAEVQQLQSEEITPEETAAGDMPEWLKETRETTKPTAPAWTVPAEAEEEQAPAWVSESERAAVEAVAASDEQAPSEEAPAWLRGSGTAPAESVAMSEDQVPSGEAPAWLRKPRAQATPVESAPVTPELQGIEIYQETAPEPAPETPAPVESLPPIVVETSQPGAMPAAAPAEKRKRQPKGHAHLVRAREHREAKRLRDALAEYDYVVQHAPRLVNDVIDDLEALTQRPETPLLAHRILGDAYTRADRLSEALERYRFLLEYIPEGGASS